MIDVLTPILGRPPNAMLRSLEHATSTDFQVYLLCSPGDDTHIEACRETGYPTLVVEWEPGRADYAKKMNFGFAHSAGEWIFQGADDIRFQPGWDTAALRVARQTNAQVIGTNDLHNPAVVGRWHSTHSLIARVYVERRGATFDGTGPLFCEAYDHQYIDNELVELAKRRRTWAFSAESVVEHLHPAWGLAEWDRTYRKAFRETAQDRTLFMHRRRLSKSNLRRQTPVRAR